jgi:WhiB family redox-sensing transcriptional regulator
LAPQIEIVARPEDEWMSKAKCVGIDPNIFDGLQKSKYSPIDYSEAIAVCSTCPVRLFCLEDAIMHDETACVRGGMTPDEYQEMKADPTPRATPLKRNPAQRMRAPRRKLAAA